jgi:hypothetical protein
MKTFKDIQIEAEKFGLIQSKKFPQSKNLTFAKFASNVQRELKKQYGSTRHFCRVNQLNYYTITNGLNLRLSPESTNDVFRCIANILETEFKMECSNCITYFERESIRIGIATKFRNIKSFVEQNPHHTYPFVHNVISGKRKLADARFIKLFNDVVK